MSWLRKGPLGAALAGGLLLWLLIALFFDTLLKRALIAGGERAAGAKVEIGSARSRWLKGSLELDGVAVADRERPMTNAAELSRAAFRLDVGAALRGKAVIREASLEGLRFGTPRKTSGALRAAPPSKLAEKVKAAIAPAPGGGALSAGDVKENAAAQVDASKLAGLKRLDEGKAKAAEIEARWRGKQDEAKAVEKESREIADQLKALGGGDSSPAGYLKKAQAAQGAQARLKALIARVDAQRAQAQKDVAEARAALNEADELRKKDLNGLLAAAGLPQLDAQDLGRRLLGAPAAARLATALHWLKLAKEHAAARKAANPPPPPRRRGIDVEFPVAHAYPQFLLENAKLSGALDGVPGGALDVAGLLSGVTSNPKLYGKPATLALAGRSGAGVAARLDARLDQQADPVGISLDFAADGLSLAGATLGDGQLGGAVKDGRASVKGRLACRGDEWSGEIQAAATGVALEPAVKLDGAAGALAAEALRSLKSFRVTIGLSGREDDLKLTFKTDAGDAVAAALRKAASGRVEAEKKKLEAKLDALYGPKERELKGQTDALSGKILGPLDAQKAGLERQLQDALGKTLGKPGLPSLNKLFGR